MGNRKTSGGTPGIKGGGDVLGLWVRCGGVSKRKGGVQSWELRKREGPMGQLFLGHISPAEEDGMLGPFKRSWWLEGKIRRCKNCGWRGKRLSRVRHMQVSDSKQEKISERNGDQVRGKKLMVRKVENS